MPYIIALLLSLAFVSPAYADINSDLTAAAYSGNTTSVGALLNKGADINAKSRSKWTALMYAASRGKTATVMFLLNQGAEMEVKNRHGYTALMLAALSGHRRVVEVLLNIGADKNVKAKNGYTAWKLAKEEGYSLIAKILQMAEGQNISPGPVTIIANGDKNYDDIDKLLRRQKNSKKPRETRSIYKGWFYLGTFNKKKWSPKTIQGYENRVPEKGEKITLSTPMYLRDDMPRADKNSRLVPPYDIPMKTELTVKDIDPKVGLNQIWVQVQFSDDDIIKSAKQARKIDLALLVAVNKGETKAMLAALKKAPNINARYKDGMTPLIRAAKKGYTQIVKEILKQNPEIDAEADDGWSALMTAAWKGRRDIVGALLERGADVNKISNNNWTALLAASKYGHSGIVEMLINKGADVTAKNRHKKTALMLARAKGHAQIVNLLKQKGALKN